MPVRGFWSNAFRLGLYDALVPINYDQSLQEAWSAVEAGPGDQVLDAGCGSGRLLLHARKWLAGGGRLTAIDIDEPGLAFAKRRARRLGVKDRIEFRNADLCRLSELALPPFEAAFAHFSLYTLPTNTDRRLALEQVASAVRPGGRCVFVVPSENYRAQTIINDACAQEQLRRDAPWWSRALRRHVLYRFTRFGLQRIESALDHDLFHRYSRSEIENQCSSAGLTDVHITPVYASCGFRVAARRTAVPAR
jgi:ubiquinone/menaquinone biosynthesis C-methylase UbiE